MAEAIFNDRYILTSPQDVQHDGSLSGNGTLTSPLGVVPGYNETVLWSGAGTSAVTLSESITNFDTIKIKYGPDSIVWHEYPGMNNNKAHERIIAGGTSAQNWFGDIFMVFNNNKINVLTAWCYSVTNQMTYNTGYNYYALNSIMEVRGINRKQ